MGYIREPKGVDFIVEPTVLNNEDVSLFREAIAEYKKTGIIPDDKQISLPTSIEEQSGASEKKKAYNDKKSKNEKKVKKQINKLSLTIEKRVYLSVKC